MAKYRILERSFVNHRIHEVGEVVEHEFSDGGTHGPNFEPVDATAQPAKPARAKRTTPPATGAKPVVPPTEVPPGTGARPDDTEGDDAEDLV